MRENFQTTRRTVLTTTGTISLLGVAGVVAGESEAVETAPLPDDPDEYTYPTMGVNDDAPTAKVYGNFKCPYTRKLVLGNLEAIIDEFVSTGRLNIQFCNLTYEPGDTSTYFISSSDPRIASVSIGIWNEDPDSYWDFYDETFNDPPSGTVEYDDLATRAKEAGVSNVDEIIDRAKAGDFDDEIERVAEMAADDGVSFTPQLELAGEITAPHHNEQKILDWIDSRVDDAPTESAENTDDTTEASDDGGDDADEESADDAESTADKESTDDTASESETVEQTVSQLKTDANDDGFEWVQELENAASKSGVTEAGC